MANFRGELKGSKVGTCCYGCSERFPACHDVCATYLKSKAEWIERQRVIKENKKKSRVFEDFHYGQVAKTKRAKERKNSKHYGEV